jgi:rubrerythrin
VAEAQGEKQAQRVMHWALEAEKIHSQLYGAAKQKAAAKQDTGAADIWICTACGYTVEGEAPEVCPLCGAKHTKFRKF